MWISVLLQRAYFMTLKTMYTIGYCTSLVTLTIALVVLASLRWGEAPLGCLWAGRLVISADTDPSVGFQGKLNIAVFLKTYINQWRKWAESCLTENVRAVPHIVLSCPSQHLVYHILQIGVCTISLLRFCHDFDVPGERCLSSYCSLPHPRLWLKLCSKNQCIDF